jgi:cell division protein FtsL
MRIIDWAFSEKKYQKQRDDENKTLTENIDDSEQINIFFVKYTLVGILLISLLFIPIIKNKTRNFQKEINNLEASIGVLNSTLNHAKLDNEIITSSENISKLAKEHLNIELVSYKRSQIKNFSEAHNLNSKKKNIKKNKNIKAIVKSQIEKNIEAKKKEIKKLQELYAEPKKIPNQARTLIVKKISDAKNDLKVLYDSPKDFVTLERARRWGVVQVVKVFLGIPVIPGR